MKKIIIVGFVILICASAAFARPAVPDGKWKITSDSLVETFNNLMSVSEDLIYELIDDYSYVALLEKVINDENFDLILVSAMGDEAREFFSLTFDVRDGIHTFSIGTGSYRESLELTTTPLSDYLYCGETDGDCIFYKFSKDFSKLYFCQDGITVCFYKVE